MNYCIHTHLNLIQRLANNSCETELVRITTQIQTFLMQYTTMLGQIHGMPSSTVGQGQSAHVPPLENNCPLKN